MEEIEESLAYALLDVAKIEECCLMYEENPEEYECPLCRQAKWDDIALGDSGLAIIPRIDLFTLDLPYVVKHITKSEAQALSEKHAPVATDMVE